MPQHIAVHFGAGNIGRGFLGQLYFESGFKTIFIDTDAVLVRTLNSRGEYPLHIVDEERQTIVIENFEAYHASDERRIVDAIAAATIVSTAVGANALPAIAPVLAKGIEQRLNSGTPLNILLCENHEDAAALLSDEVKTHLPSNLQTALADSIGFVNASIGRMARDATPAEIEGDPLALSVEPYCELPVDAAALVEPFPLIDHLAPEQNFAAILDMKRFIHNAGHAATAYLGHLQGHSYIAEAIRDISIREKVDAAMTEASKAISAEHGTDIEVVREHWQGLRKRFENRALGDTIQRVARDPIRKLGPNDRLIGAGTLCLKHGIVPTHLALAAAAAILYDRLEDSQARRLRTMIESEGVEAVLGEVCGIPEGSPLRSMIHEAYRSLSESHRSR